jgi:hypothetical membrane protein
VFNINLFSDISENKLGTTLLFILTTFLVSFVVVQSVSAALIEFESAVLTV